MTRQVIDMTGVRCGRLLVVGGAASPTRKARWKCVCDCGTEIETEGCRLRRGHVKSCGCLLRDKSTRHGLSRSPEYVVWKGMRQRCGNPKSMSYMNYGARGIKVCERWNDFGAFLSDMGERPSRRYTIERLNNDIGYCPDNCIWATRLDQGKNTSRVKKLNYAGRPITINQIAEMSGYKPKSVATFLRSGRTVEAILEACI